MLLRVVVVPSCALRRVAVERGKRGEGERACRDDFLLASLPTIFC